MRGSKCIICLDQMLASYHDEVMKQVVIDTNCNLIYLSMFHMQFYPSPLQTYSVKDLLVYKRKKIQENLTRDLLLCNNDPPVHKSKKGIAVMTNCGHAKFY